MNSRASGRAIGGSPALTLTGETPTATCPRATRPTSASPSSRAITIMSATAPTRRSTGWSAICSARACRCASIRRRSKDAGVRADRRSGQHPRRSRSPAGRNIACRSRIPARGPARPRRVRAQHRPHRQPRHRRPSRGQLGAPSQDRRRRLGPHPVRHLSALIIICSCSSRARARSCAASTTAARSCSPRRNRPRRSCARSG